MFKNLFFLSISLFIFYISTGYSQAIKDYSYAEFPAKSTDPEYPEGYLKLKTLKISKSNEIDKIHMELTIEFKDFVEILLSDDKYKDKKTYLFEDVKAIGNGIEKMNISDVFDINYMNGISIAGKYQDEKIFTVKNFLYNLKQGCCMGCMSIAIAGTKVVINPLFVPQLNLVPIPLENRGEDLLTKVKWYTTNWEGKESTFIKICIQFKNGGEYLIAVLTNGHYINGYHHFQFFVKIQNGEGKKCFFKNFKNMSGEDLEILEDYRKEMEIVVIPKM
uniref:Uncharacterized protein n=1 Tax=Meloidogyne enterolobii TaxID=390850 RepID=A0A6V7TXQ3_MELEN|nr:unnamed protein product [Meloidogyne enterolobii]